MVDSCQQSQQILDSHLLQQTTFVAIGPATATKISLYTYCTLHVNLKITFTAHLWRKLHTMQFAKLPLIHQYMMFMPDVV